MRDIKQSLATLKERFNKIGGEQSKVQQAVAMIWQEWFGSELKTAVETIHLKRQQLSIKTKNKSVANELWLRRTELLSALRAKQIMVEEIKIY